MWWVPHEPKSVAETRPYWDGLRQNQFLIQQDRNSGEFIFPPKPDSLDLDHQTYDWVEASGEGWLYSFVVNHFPWPEWGTDEPTVIALVRLKEGPIIVSRIVNFEGDPEDLVLDAPLMAKFVNYGEDTVMLCFEPLEAGA